MPRRCGSLGCREEVEPVALKFHTDAHDGWFLVCPICHYVFGRIDDPAAAED